MGAESVVVVDYGMGNLASMTNALQHLGASPLIAADAQTIAGADRLVLPGVGAFGRCTHELHERGLIGPLAAFRASGRPILGVCLGFQVLFERSFEYGEHTGLGWIEGRVTRFNEPGLIIPHMGWNQVQVTQSQSHPLFYGVSSGSHVYFVHSYRPEAVRDEVILAHTDYGGGFPCAVARENVAGVQFHPEKSGPVGLKILKNFLTWRP